MSESSTSNRRTWVRWLLVAVVVAVILGLIFAPREEREIEEPTIETRAPGE